jgi:hypothetical protein
MIDAPKDLENANDNLPLEHELAIVLAWARQAGFPNIAATLQRVLTELETRPK